MTVKELFFFVSAILGGLTLFIFGMHIMTEGLRLAAGKRLRRILANTTRNRCAGIGLGTLLGFIAHSGPTVVMLIGFINAGLITLAESIAPVMGANLGTTLSMQLVSFHLNDYCFFVMALGFILKMAAPPEWLKHGGYALMGFGMLFLGMATMGEAIEPHRDHLAPLLARIHGDTLGGLLTGVLISTLLTAAVQSSGAMIGICFVLARAGVFSDLTQIYPIVLGAHIGTCSTALLAAIGTNIYARRAAAAHLAFNIFGAVLAIAAAPLFIRLMQWTSPDLTRQVANLHTFVMLAAAAVLLPFTGLCARFMTLVVPSRLPPPPPSVLDSTLFHYPEKAIYAAIQELQRVTRICARSFHLAAAAFFQPRRKVVRVIKLNENVVDEIKKSMKEYLAELARRKLSRRQAILLQHINRCMTDLERIGDHIDEICDISIRRRAIPQARFNHDSLELLFNQFQAGERVLLLVIDSLNPNAPNVQAVAEEILKARDEYMQGSLNAKAVFNEKIATHELPPIQGIFFNEYIAALDRIVKHAKTIALVEKQPFFWIKRKKLERAVDENGDYQIPPLSDPHDFLDKLHAEDYL